MSVARPNLTLVSSAPPKLETTKKYSFDILQVDEGSQMMTVDACLPIPVVMQLLKLLEPYT